MASAVALTLGLSACGATSSTTSASSSHHYTIGFIPGDTTDPFFVSMGQGATYEAKKLGVNLIWTGNPTWDYEEQDPYVSGLIAKHVNFLVIDPNSATASIPAIKSATNAGISVGTVDATINAQNLLKFMVTSDNIQGGAEAANWVAQKIGDKGEVAVLNDQQGVTTTDLRNQGFIDQIKKYPNIRVVADDFVDDSTSTAEADMQSILLAHPRVKAVYGVMDYAVEGAALAVTHAKRTQNSSHPVANGIWIIGYDAEPSEVADLNNGSLQALIAQKPYMEGEIAVQYAYDFLSGKKDAIKKDTYLTNVLATKANEASTSKWFYK